MEWEKFFDISNEILGKGEQTPKFSNSWCAWTTFSKLEDDCHYWKCGLPRKGEYDSLKVLDGGLWGQPFHYSDIAHIILPAKFLWESFEPGNFEQGAKYQNIAKLSQKLKIADIPHRVTPLILEVKIY